MSKIWPYAGMFAAGFAFALTPGGATLQSAPNRAMAVVFAPTGNTMKIHRVLQSQLKSATKSIDVAMFSFTSKRLANVLKTMAKKVRVRVLADRKSAREIKLSVYKNLEKAGVQIKYVKLGGQGFRAEKFHHKFCVIDALEVCTGSYNWTVQADTTNYENFLVIRDKSLAKKFASEFERIWRNKDLAKDSI